ncbi:hypothetical protein [Klebsiella pneumoniae]|uniref:hypothetical protein n=1 Tax=Klebsiella pneumoniae TaxID=573 RepID=UPI001D18D910|nr:hypothetical protein [Klebsiella pneumoniae]
MARDSLYPVSVKAGKPILGMLPTGWQKLSLEKCLNIEARKAYIQDNQEYDLVTVKRSRGGVIRREHLKGKDISVKSQFYIKEGDFLISKRQLCTVLAVLYLKNFLAQLYRMNIVCLQGSPVFIFLIWNFYRSLYISSKPASTLALVCT